MNTLRNGTDPESAVRLIRDNETRTYRLFTELGLSNNDFSIDELKRLSEALAAAVASHEEWQEYDEGDE